jgi:hypothetical protein
VFLRETSPGCDHHGHSVPKAAQAWIDPPAPQAWVAQVPVAQSRCDAHASTRIPLSPLQSLEWQLVVAGIDEKS